MDECQLGWLEWWYDIIVELPFVILKLGTGVSIFIGVSTSFGWDTTLSVMTLDFSNLIESDGYLIHGLDFHLRKMPYFNQND